MSQTMNRDAREAMPATEPRDAEQAGVVEARERLFADLDTAAIGLRLMAAEHPRLKLGPVADRVAAHAREILTAASPPPQPTPEAREAGDGWLERLEGRAEEMARDMPVGHCGESTSDRICRERAEQYLADLRIAITRARAAAAAEALLRECAEQFLMYERQHRAKGDSQEAQRKANVNAAFAARIATLLTGSKQ